MNDVPPELLENRLAGRFAGRLAGRVHSPDATLTAQVISWLDLVDLCRELDESVDSNEGPMAETLAVHEAIINLAIGCGGWLIHRIGVEAVDLSPSGQTLDTLDASLGLLRIMRQRRHPSLPPEEIEAVRKRVFNVAA